MFLTASQVAELTGRKRPSAQIRWLEAHKYPHVIGSDRRPKVLCSVVEDRLGGVVERTTQEPRLRFT